MKENRGRRPGSWVTALLLIPSIIYYGWKGALASFLIGWAINLAYAKWKGEL